MTTRKALVAALCAVAVAGAQSPPNTAARRGLPLTPTRPLKFTTSEGTWLSLDVSPDGRMIVFDLLGDLYTVPIAGGRAARLTSGQAFDTSPRFSPDGRSVVFVSDRDGSDNLWIMNSDGSGPRQLTKTEWFGYVSPEWTPDGKFIVVARNQSDKYYQPFSLYQYHVDGGVGQRITDVPASGTPPAAGAAAPQPGNYFGPTFTPDGRYIYVARGRAGRGTEQVVMIDRSNGENYVRSNESGGAMRPAVSPDGRYLVFGSRDDAKTGLKIRDLRTGDERWLTRDVQRDQAENFAIERDALPGSSFTPDSRAFVTAFGGKIWSIDLATAKRTEIPFTADVDQTMGPLLRFDYPMNDTVVTARQIRNPRLSPDGRRLAFVALDKLYAMDYPSGSPKRLTSLPGSEGYPAWSPDGRYIAFVRRTGEDSGGVYRVPADGSGQPEALTRQPGLYTRIVYSRDGSRIVGTRQPLRIRDERGALGSELVWIPANGGPTTLIGLGLATGTPHFGPEADRIYTTAGEGLVSFRFDGTDRRVHLRATARSWINASASPVSDLRLSPTGDYAVAVGESNVYLITLGTVPLNLTVDVNQRDSAAVPVRRVTRIAGDFVSWRADGKAFTYSLGSSFFVYDIAQAAAAVRDSVVRGEGAGRVAYDPQVTNITITAPKDRPQGMVLLRGARLITMKGNEIIENGDLLVRDNRIVAIGRRGAVAAPANTRTFDLSGKTIIPGYVDLHAHPMLLAAGSLTTGLHNSEAWVFLVNLAYGVTTMRDPQTSGTDVFDYADRLETGEILGPRLFAVVGSSRVDLQACKLEYSIVSPK